MLRPTTPNIDFELLLVDRLLKLITNVLFESEIVEYCFYVVTGLVLD